MHLLASFVFFAILEQLQTGGNKQVNEGVCCKRNGLVVAESLQPFSLRKC